MIQNPLDILKKLCQHSHRTFLFRDVLKQTYEKFNGHFETDCQKAFIPETLQSLITLILRGGQKTDNPFFNQAMLTISQLLIHNTTIRTRKEQHSAYHTTKREPPISIYLAQLIHSKTRKLDLVETLSHLGITISPNRMLEISTSLGNTSISVYEKEGVVCPPNLKLNLFTTAAIDNLDINTTSATATSSFHGTAASLNQHVRNEQTGQERTIFGNRWQIEATSSILQ